MPTYEYQCQVCGTVFDMFQSIKASPLRKAECEACGKKQSVKRLIGTGGAVIFKGSGFYQTDYRSSSYKEGAKAESGDGKKADADTTKTTTDSKPAKSEKKTELKSKASPKKTE